MRLAVRTLRAPIRSARAGGALLGSRGPIACQASSASLFAGRSSAASAVYNIRSFPFSTSSFASDESTAALRRERDTREQQYEEEMIEDELEDGQNEAQAPKERKIPERDATFASMKPYMSYPTWKALTVKPFGYKDMSDVQQSVLHLLPELSDPTDQPMSDGKGRDLLVKARTGTGKTIAFLVPAIERRVKAIHHAERGRLTGPFQKMVLERKPDFDFESLDKHGRQALARQFATNTVGTLVISPTRELATQIANEAVKLHFNHERFGVQLLVGGASKGQQLGDWRRSRPDVVVATPGRLKDLMQTEPMVGDALKATQTLVLDEADTLLEMGFRSEIEEIVRQIPQSSNRTSMLFSATVSKDIQAIARKSMEKDYRYIDCVPEGEENITQRITQYATVLDNAGEQLAHITRLIAMDQLQNAGKSKVIVFANTTKQTQLLSQLFSSREIKSCLPAGVQTNKYEIHAKKEQAARFTTSDKFRRDQTGASILFTTDVSARGVDYPGTTRVIQVGVPSSKDQYTHRIGRTGRAGLNGCGDLILQPFEVGFMHANLGDVPIQTRSVQQVQEELESLAADFDADPTSVVDEEIWSRMNQAQSSFAGRGAGSMSRKRSGSRGGPRSDFQHGGGRGPTLIQSPLQPRVAVIDENALAVSEAMDPEEVQNVFFSSIGFYVGIAHELRISKNAVVEGFKKWAIDFGKLDREPFLSPGMMQKMGINDESRKGYGPRRDYNSGGGGGGGGGYGGGAYRGGDRGGGRFSRDGGERSSQFGDRGRGGFSRGRGGGRGGFGDRPSYGDRDGGSSFSSRPSYGDRNAGSSYGDRDGGRGRGGSSFGRGRGRGASSYGGGDRYDSSSQGGYRGSSRGGFQAEFSD